MSCLKLSPTDVSGNNVSRSVPPSSRSPSDSLDKKDLRIKDLSFSDQSSLNLMTEIKIKINSDSNFPLGSYLILNDEDDVIFLGRIDSRAESLNLTVPFNLKRLRVRVVGSENGTRYLEKIILIRDGVINI
tara:strand:- start:5 stop:397 length:393 start_codon:yes stop_codon:yes gene_type:complete